MDAPRPRPAVRVIHPVCVSGRGIGGDVLALCDSWTRAGVTVEAWVPAVVAGHERPYQRVPVPDLRARLHYKFGRPEADLARRVEAALVAQVRPGDLVDVWPGTSFELVRELRGRGARVALERVNTHRAHARRVLDRLYARHGLDRDRPLTPTHDHGPYEALRETRKLELADVVVSPSPLVTASLVEQGIDSAKIVRSSNGWDPRTFDAAACPPRVGGGRTRFLFLGHDALRKGLGELLAAWRLANGPGELRAAAELPEPLRRRWARDLVRDEVSVEPPSEDPAPLLAASDVFVLPSHEEGSPLEVYQALAAGRPCLVGPAAGGELVRDGIDGFVRDPDDTDAWALALVELARDAALRAELGANARERAAGFTWERVAARRWAALSQRLAPGVWRLSA